MEEGFDIGTLKVKQVVHYTNRGKCARHRKAKRNKRADGHRAEDLPPGIPIVHIANYRLHHIWWA
jgi:hypothetical protein